MRQQFMNEPSDVEWILQTTLKGVPGIPAFKSFVIVGNEDSPEELHLYESANPLYTDRYFRIVFDSRPIYIICEWIKGKAQ